jgi:pyrimidine operon attenuation protein/uracil phosphoribosyltransferase
MNVKRKVGIILLALTLAPVYAVAQDDEKEFKATVVTKSEKEIKVKTKDEEKTVLIGSKTKGVENAKEGSKVTIKYTEKEGKVRATEINPR